MHHSILHFPQLRLNARDAHKLRGYFADRFREESDLFHNHEADGKSIYRYPLIQYKVIGKKPIVVGLGEGAKWLVRAFLQVDEIQIDEQVYPIQNKNLKSRDVPIGVGKELYRYEFYSPWMALNQKNYSLFKKMSSEEQNQKLQKILIGNILSFFNAFRHHEKQQVMLHLRIKDRLMTHFKNQTMETYRASFVTNVQLPDYIGLGKSVSRGFGTIKKM